MQAATPNPVFPKLLRVAMHLTIKVVGKSFINRRKNNFYYEMVIILTLSGSTLRQAREHLWSSEQWLGTTALTKAVERGGVGQPP